VWATLQKMTRKLGRSSSGSGVSAKGAESVTEATYSFLLRSGRRVWLDAFHFDKTYANLFFGVPKPESHYITKQEKNAEAMWGPNAAFTIPPVTVAREYGGLKYQSWPYYCYKAWLTSEKLDPSFLRSQLIVIWFGEEVVTTSFLAMIEEACRDLQWEQYAKGGDPLTEDIP
jgi:hypothetical protein